MNTLRAAIVPGLIAGIASIFTSWFWMGIVFHRFQKETPDTWRPEGGRSYFAASLIHVVCAIAVACIFTLVVRFNVGFFSAGIGGSIGFGFALWVTLAVPILVESAVFIRLHPLVVAGQLLDWLTLLTISCAVTRWWVEG